MTHRARTIATLGLTLALLVAPAAALAIDAPHDTLTCDQCHAAHGATYPNMLGELCEFCHYPSGPATAVSTHSSRTSDSSYGDWDLDCWACHNPHLQEQDNTWATSYGMLLKVDLNADVKEIDPLAPGPYWPPLSILRTVTSNDVEHTSSTTFVDGDGSFTDDTCQVCHLSTVNYNTGAAFNVHTDYGPDSQPGGTCSTCHPHDKGFATSACLICHDEAQPNPGLYRRQIVGASGDFERPTHHVTDGTPTEMVDNDDCMVCHDQANHQSNAEPAVQVSNADDGVTSYTFDGTGGSLEAFCLSCHDADSSQAFDSDGNSGNGHQPFADGLIPTDIATDYAGAAHDTGLPGEACLACHGGPDSTQAPQPYDRNAHGSDLPKMLSAVIDDESPGNVEEALCQACHDGDGAALTDIETEIGKGVNGNYVYHHPVVDTEQVVGREVECTDCHHEHAALGSDPVFGAGGIDLSGGTVARGAPVEQHEVCFKCHGDTYNSSRGDWGGNVYWEPTNKRTDFAADNHSYHPVTQPGRSTSTCLEDQLLSPWTTASTMDCTDCHNTDDATAPQGPHGSNQEWILAANYQVGYKQSGTPQASSNYSSSNFALCFDCHDEPSLTSNNDTTQSSAFSDGNDNLHARHMVSWDSNRITCRNCHWEIHSNQAATNTQWRVQDGMSTYVYDNVTPPTSYKTRGVSFSPDVTATSYAKPAIRYRLSDRRRTCYLNCHGKGHSESYDPPSCDDDPLTY